MYKIYFHLISEAILFASLTKPWKKIKEFVRHALTNTKKGRNAQSVVVRNKTCLSKIKTTFSAFLLFF